MAMHYESRLRQARIELDQYARRNPSQVEPPEALIDDLINAAAPATIGSLIALVDQLDLWVAALSAPRDLPAGATLRDYVEMALYDRMRDDLMQWWRDVSYHIDLCYICHARHAEVNVCDRCDEGCCEKHSVLDRGALQLYCTTCAEQIAERERERDAEASMEARYERE